MLTLPQILASNSALSSKHESMTAVFTGATDGIGLGTLIAFVRHIPRPTAFIIGRSQARFTQKLHEVQELNPCAMLVFIEAQVSLIRSIDALCDDLKDKVPTGSIDLVCMSPGYAPLGARKFTDEGLEEAMTLAVYGRMRLVHNLISMQLLKPEASIVSILAGGKEGHFFEDDPELLKNYSIFNLRGHFTTLTTLAFDKLSAAQPTMAFTHVYPGNVDTGLRYKAQVDSCICTLFVRFVGFLLSLYAITPEESGERMLCVATMGGTSKSCRSLDCDLSPSKSTALSNYRATEHAQDFVWDHLLHLFDRALRS